jgi:predicted NAD/FAD-dependent oxidoreductase
VAIVGAGLAGLSAARILVDHGWEVDVFEKSRGTGGRLATRRIDELAFDIGAQYFTVRDPRFRRWVSAWQQQGLVAPWPGRIHALHRSSAPPPLTRFVGVPRMSALSRHLAENQSIHFATRVTALQRETPHWRVHTEEGAWPNVYHGLVVALPPAQAAALLDDVPELQKRAAAVEAQPCWAVLAAFNQPLPLTFDGLFANHPRMDWAARNNSKPGRPPTESWVLHASADWSIAHLEEEADTIGPALLQTFFDISGLSALAPRLLQAHRWRYARALHPLSSNCLWECERRVSVCGDWCHGGRIEGAVLSGMAAAGRLLGLPDREF